MSSDNDVPSWGIPLIDAYESNPEAPKATPQSPDQAPLSPTHAPELRRILRRTHRMRRRSSQLWPIPHQLDYTLTYHMSWVAALAPPLPLPSPLSSLSSPLPMIPSLPLLLPPPTCRDIIPEADTRPQKRARFAAPSHRFESWESSAAAAARQPGSTLARGTDYGFLTALEEVNKRVTDLATSHRHDSEEFHRQDDGNRWTRALGHIQELERSREPERRDGPPDASSSSKSDSDDEEYVIKRNKFGAPIYGPKPTQYLNCTNPEDRSSAKQTTSRTHEGEAESSRSKCPRQHETVEEVLLPQVHYKFLLWKGCSRDTKYRVREAESDEEIFTSVAWIRAFNINEPIYAELCHEFYSTYEFDEVRADDELQSKKIIKFRLGGRAHSLTLLEFGRRLGLYQVVELEEDDFNVYFEGCLRNDDNFNARDFWKIGYHKVQKNNFRLLRAGTQKESQIYCGQFISKLARKCRVLTKDVVRSLCAPVYYKYLDSTTLRDLIVSEGKLILEDPQPGVPRVGIMECLSIWLRFIVFQCREPITRLAMLSHSMTSTISSTHLRHHSISSSMMMTSSVEMTRVGYVTACLGHVCFKNSLKLLLLLWIKEDKAREELARRKKI
nr:hypothetical protein [Tanacetum cinerariifolium]